MRGAAACLLPGPASLNRASSSAASGRIRRSVAPDGSWLHAIANGRWPDGDGCGDAEVCAHERGVPCGVCVVLSCVYRPRSRPPQGDAQRAVPGGGKGRGPFGCRLRPVTRTLGSRPCVATREDGSWRDRIVRPSARDSKSRRGQPLGGSNPPPSASIERPGHRPGRSASRGGATAGAATAEGAATSTRHRRGLPAAGRAAGQGVPAIAPAVRGPRGSRPTAVGGERGRA
jgi:hypothetical protein